MGKPNGAVSSKGNSRSIQEEAQLRTDEVVFVSHGDLLRLALRCHCHGIHSEAILALCRPENNFWVFKATVFKSSRCRGFVGYRYIIKTDKLVEELKLTVNRALEELALREENVRLRRELLRVFAHNNIIGASRQIQSILEMVRTVAPTTSTVLLTGESGTG